MFSSSWTDRQGQVGDLKNQSKEELTELLLRQEKILSNKKLLQTLPDKGKKIKEFAEKVRLAIEEQSEEETRKNMVSAARTELQSKYQKAVQQRAISIDSHQNKLHEDAAGEDMQDSETSPVAAQEDTQLDQYVSRAAVESMETAAAGTPLNIDETKEGELVEALDRVTLSETGSGESKDQNNSRTKENYFLRKQPSKKPHYVTVLEKTEAASRRPKFKPNQLAPKQEASSSGCSSPGQSSVSASPRSAQARRERDWKHLDDITAAKLPPLHHNPAQLLSLEESAVLLKEQTKKHQELQAKLAAQKLSEGLKTSMGSYTPDGGPMAAYREVHDEGVHLSSEED